MSLFSLDDIKTPQKKDFLPESAALKTKNVYKAAKAKDKLIEAIPFIEMGYTYHIPCFVHWSLHDLMAYLLTFTGLAKVWLTSWAISENPVRMMMQLIDEGKVSELSCVFDSRIKSQCPSAAQLLQRNFTKIGLCDIHAKVLVIINDSWAISVTATANLTNKRRVEKYVICCDRAVAENDVKWIKQLLENSNPFE
jgi:hypothetical protein